MSLSQEAIEEYKRIYKKEFGKDISDEEAREQGENLIELFKVIYRPIPKDMTKEPKTSLYKLTPDHYDAMMTTELETHIFQTVVNEIKNNLKPEKTLILDLCCGTGLLAQMLSNVPDIEFIGVDINSNFLKSVQEKTKQYDNFNFILQDILKYETEIRFDIILLTSAYHHVENKFKPLLLQKISKFLREDGVLIIYEKLISPSKSKKEFKENNEEFYLKRIEYLKKTESKRLSEKQFNSLMNICALSALAEEEYKIDYNYIVNDLNRAGFLITKEIKIWPKDNLFSNEKVGDFIFIVKKS